MVEEPPVAPNVALAPSEKLDLTLSATREAARFNGEAVAAPAARATPPRPEVTPTAPDWPSEATLIGRGGATSSRRATTHGGRATGHRCCSSLQGKARGAACGERGAADRETGAHRRTGAELGTTTRQDRRRCQGRRCRGRAARARRERQPWRRRW